jgi:ribose 5-phosphate isomerase B
MTIALGADHAGYELKELLRTALEELGHQVIDVGTHSAASVDYPHYARAVVAEVLGGRAERGVLVCGTGAGVAMTANRTPGIRAVSCSDTFTARMARAHNDANVLALGSRVVGPGLARDLVSIFLDTPFEGGRHQRRVEQIEAGGVDSGGGDREGS